jgi:transposase
VAALFIKTSWGHYKGKRYPQYHLAESYRDPETGRPRHRLLINLTKLPPHALEAVRQALRTGQVPASGPVQVKAGDKLRGAGVLAIWSAWKRYGMDEVLAGLTRAERASVLAMVVQRIVEPGSKLSLKERLQDTVLARHFAPKRLDEDELYRVMDRLHAEFYQVQQRLWEREGAAPVLCLYDITSTYFEGRKAEDGEYGYSRDKRWDRYQIVIGLVLNQDGVPLAVEVWPGATADRTTVVDRVKALKERFGITRAVFVGDGGMYSEANVAALEEAGFDYILGVDWQRERVLLEEHTPQQFEVFDRVGVVEWEKDGVRYVGCVSEARRQRAAERREAGMQKAREKLEQLARVAAGRRIYRWTRLRAKAEQILKEAGVAGLWRVEISPLEAGPVDPEQKAKLRLHFEVDQEALRRRMAVEGKYLLQTSLPAERCSARDVDQCYRSLQKVERAFRHIKSFLEIRPVYHWRRRRIRAHVLICFLAYYLVRKMELELRAQGEVREVERILRNWDQLELVEIRVEVGDVHRREWQWSLGKLGTEIQSEIQRLGWWSEVDAQARSLRTTLAS